MENNTDGWQEFAEAIRNLGRAMFGFSRQWQELMCQQRVEVRKYHRQQQRLRDHVMQINAGSRRRQMRSRRVQL